MVYEKDLGKKTEARAKSMKEYNPDSTWKKVEVMQEDTANDKEAK